MNNAKILNEGLHLIKDLSDITSLIVGPTAICRRLQQSSQLAAYLIAQRQPETSAMKQSLVQLIDQITDFFNLKELKDLCLRLHIDHEEIAGETRSRKVHELVTYVKRRNRLPELVNQCATLRPGQSWQVWSSLQDLAPVPKDELVVIVNLASRFASTMPSDVASYLDQNTDVKANFLLLQNPNEKKDIDWDGQWDQFTAIFARARGKAQRLTAASRATFFLSGPGPILFAFGCIWGDVKPATVYHFIDGKYQPVIKISRDLI